MSPYFSVHPVTTVLFVVTVGIWVTLEARQGLRRRTGASVRDRGSYFLVVAGVAAGWIATVAALHVPGAAFGAEAAVLSVGFVLTWVGIAVRLWAFHTLGDYFTFRVQTSADQPVVTDGPYRFVRHPGYTGILLTLIGLSLLYGTCIGVAAMIVIPTAGVVHRIRVEERALDADLGPAYRAYAAGRKRLLPYVW